jgi:signal transduction histidine kinase
VTPVVHLTVSAAIGRRPSTREPHRVTSPNRTVRPLRLEPSRTASADARLSAVFAVAQLLAREPDGDALIRTLALQLPALIGADLAIIATVQDGELMSMACSTPVTDAPTIAMLRAIMTVSASRRESLVAGDAFATIPGTFSTPASIGWRSLIVMPALHHAGHPLAVLLIASSRDDAFVLADQQLLGTIAEQTVVGLDRAQLLGRLSEWSNGMEALLAFSASVHQQRAPEALVNEMVEHAARFLKADAGRGGLSVSTGSEVVMTSSAFWEHGQWTRAPRKWARREGIPGRILDHEFAYLAPDYPHDPASDPDLVAKGTIRHALAVPLRDASHTVVGFLELHRGVERPAFTWNDAAFLEALADTTAMAIENSRLVSALEAKNDEVRLLFARYAERLEEERQQIARDLHDETGQALVGVKLALQVLARVVPNADPTLAAPLDELRVQVNQATARLRQLARRLRPPSLDQHGLSTALAQLAHDTEQRSGLAVQVDLTGLGERRWPIHETAVFRIVQEALTNAVNHAAAQRCTVQVREVGSALLVRVADDGRGFLPGNATTGLGLRGIAERAQMLGGRYQLDSAPGRGTTLSVELPLH